MTTSTDGDGLAGLTLRKRTPVSGRARPPTAAGAPGVSADGGGLLAEPFKGVTTDGRVVPVCSSSETGGPTRPIADAASPGSPRQCASIKRGALRRGRRCLAPVEQIHPFLLRHGVSLDEMSGAQRDLALALLRASLSAGGFDTARDVMRLNELVRVMTGSDEEYGEWLYWLSLLGLPSPDQPWGWQLDGHHLIVNCFVLGDQVVMTPLFMGSEPVAFPDGARVFGAEEQQGLALVRALTDAQRGRVILSPTLPGEAFTAAFRDNFELRYEGLRFDQLSTAQQALLVDLLATYVGRIRPEHAEIRMEEVRRHLGETHFAWMGGFGEDSAFYYRVHSPVILVEFDHQRGIVFDSDAPSRTHIHTVVRTPNGNDYGRDLLRQHHEQFDHSRTDHQHR